MSQLRSKSKYRKGHDDGLEPLEPLDLAASDTVDALVRGMANTAFGGRSLGEAADVLETMVRDDDCFRVVTISGAMTIAKQGLILCEMMERGWVQAIVTTGALMTHGLIEGAGMQHFKHRPSLDDATLFERGYNRVYDTIELEQNLDDAYSILSHTFRDTPGGTVLSNRTILEQIGQHLNVNVKGRAILGVAAERNIPIYVPAFTDSELGLDLAVFNQQRTRDGKTTVGFDPFLDLNDFAKRVNEHETLGIFTIGGGVPRNWAQQVGPYLEISAERLGLDQPVRRYKYAVRICPEPVHWGGLSGCSYTEGVSWGKFVPEAEGGCFAEVYADATIAWPLIVRSVMERTST